jgi:hypothetical protein
MWCHPISGKQNTVICKWKHLSKGAEKAVLTILSWSREGRVTMVLSPSGGPLAYEMYSDLSF